MPVSDNAILRQLKSHVRKHRKTEPLRAIAIDDWSCRKGFRYGTIVVDLERRTVADVLKTRSAQGTADWLKQYPGIEFISRDRCGLYAQGIRKGAPSARQIADRFHLMQNLRENIEREMTSVSRCAGRPRLPAVAGDRHEVVRRQSRLSRQALFVNAKRMHTAGRTFGDIAVEIGTDRRTIAKWVSLDDLPVRQRSTIKPSSPLYFQEFLERRWAAGDRSGRRLFQAAKVGALKEASPSFVVMRRLAMRFRGLLQGVNPSKVDRFLHDARRSRLPSLQQFARTLMRDIEAVKHAIAEPWSSGQAEGRINRLKTLKRAMYGRASIELLRARMLPLPLEPREHEK